MMNKRLKRGINIVAQKKRLIIEINFDIHKTKVRDKGQGTRDKGQGTRDKGQGLGKFFFQLSLLRIADNIFLFDLLRLLMRSFLFQARCLICQNQIEPMYTFF